MFAESVEAELRVEKKLVVGSDSCAQTEEIVKRWGVKTGLEFKKKAKGGAHKY